MNITQPRIAALFFLLACPAFAEGPFPLPSIDGKPVAVAAGQKSFRLPIGFPKIEQFYKEQLGAAKDVTVKKAGESGARTLTLTSKRKGDAWTKAVVKEGKVDTVIDVTPVIRLAEEQIEGNASPLVQFVIGRSPEAAKAAADIDHMQK